MLDFSYLSQPFGFRLPCYGMAIGRGYSVHAYSDQRATYVKDGLFLDTWIDSGLVYGQLSFTAGIASVSTGRLLLPNRNFDVFEELIQSMQLVLKEGGFL